MRLIELSKNGRRNKGQFFAKVSDDDFDVLSQFEWQAHREKNTVYAVRRGVENGKKVAIRMHRQILELSDPDIKGDHIDGDGLNCQRDNLRAATTQQNGFNRRKNSNSSSIYKGVIYHKTFKKWMSTISINQKPIFLGYYKDEIEAAKKYDVKAKELFGDFARVNFK